MSIKNITRRQFGLAVAGTIAARGMAQSGTANTSASGEQHLPREVWVASMGQMGLTAQNPQEMCRKMLNRMEEATPLRPEIVCTPEVFPFVGLTGGRRPILAEVAEERTGPILDQFANFARHHHSYIICSTYTKEAGRYYNAAVLFDREGRYVGEYRKTNPTDDEIEMGITPGPLRPPVFETSFGTMGIQICYDVNWQANWRHLSDEGAKIVFWPSAFAGGKMLNSLAWMNKYYVVSSTRFLHPTKMVNPLGDDIVVTGRAANWICAPLNLDFEVVQTVVDFRRFKDIRKKYGRGFRFRILHVEALAMVEGVSADISAAEVIREYDIPTSKELLATSTRLQHSKRPV
ncbi:MAG: carbon-nitrogen hydrolase family protein [Terriglobia bacterium]